MKQVFTRVAIVTCLLGSAAPGLAFWGTGGGHAACESCGASCKYEANLLDHCKADFHQNRQWPAQYLCADRMHARTPFDIMVRNGWRRQNLLGSHHFSPDSTQLTQSGALKVQWILSQAPQAYRQLFIERSIAPGITEQRIATARKYAADFVGDGPQPLIADTHLVSEGRPAAAVDQVNTQFRNNLRVPALPASTGSAPGQQP